MFNDQTPQSNVSPVDQFFPSFKKYGREDEVLIYGTQYGDPDEDDEEGEMISKNISIQLLINTPYIPTGNILKVKKGTRFNWILTDDEFRGLPIISMLVSEIQDATAA